ncbi:MAG: VanZ family protein [Patescibacteria group bacterium]
MIYKYWLPPILWMTIIFFLSSRESVLVSNIGTVNFFFFKSLHVIEYGILYFLLFRAFLTKNAKQTNNAYMKAFIFSFLYALSDEIHQLLVPTREGRLRDVFIDVVGMVFTYMYIKYYINKSFLKKLL